VNEKGERNKVQIKGDEVKTLYEDLTSGDSHLLKAVRTMHAALGAHRQAFREHVKFYVMEKAAIRAGITTWYDWQLFSIFTELFDQFESLRLI